MKVFASSFLEGMSSDIVEKEQEWNWNPANNGVDKIVACGAPTVSNTSTYASEEDNYSDNDANQEGMLVA